MTWSDVLLRSTTGILGVIAKILSQARKGFEGQTIEGNIKQKKIETRDGRGGH